MSFQKWLPKNERNRFAFVLANISLILLIAWNLLPASEDTDGIFAIVFWPMITDPNNYIYIIKTKDLHGMMWIAAIFAIVLSSIMSLLLVPFWRIFHATPYLRIPIAAISIIGALTISSLLFADVSDELIVSFALMALQMFTLSLALLTFDNELAWKLRDLDPRVPRKL